MLPVLAGLLVLVSGCTGTGFLNSITPDGGYSLASNVVYDPNTGLKLDVYSPPSVANAPVVVFLYGGTWQQQYTRPKEQYRFVGQALAARGYVAVIPDYRVYPQVRFPAFVSDCAAAVRWAHVNARHYGGSASKLFLLGHDAGAYNAAMLSLDPGYLKQVGGDRNWLRGMIGLAGSYDFLPITDPVLRDVFAAPEQYPSTQPILFADGSNPPMLLMAGQDDESVSVNNTLSLYDRIKRNNGTVEKVIYPSLSHSKIIAVVASRRQNESDVMQYTADFISRTLAAPQQQQNNYGIQTIVPK